MLHPKGSQHDWKRRTEHAERDERWEGCVSSAFRHEVSSPPIGDSGMLYYDVETTRPIILTHIPLSET